MPRRDVVIARLKRRERPRAERFVTPSINIIDRIKEHYGHERSSLDISLVPREYDVLINDASVVNPFIVSQKLIRIAKAETKGLSSLEDKALSLFSWVHRNIAYEQLPNGYRNAKETLYEGKGVCGEMAFVYITMARSTGLRSAYASVTKDSFGKEVSHGCAVVDTGLQAVLVDPAYHTFDIKHQEYRVRSDAEVLSMFNQWRHS